MNKITQRFAGKQFLGRVINSQGEPLDGKGPLLDAPLHHANITKSRERSSDGMLETGIKPVDLLAPLAYGGIISLFGSPGLGKLALVEEIMHNIVTHYEGYVVCVGMDEGNYEASELMEVIEELQMQDKLVLLFEQSTSDMALVYAALEIARQWREQKHEVLLIADKQTATQCNLMEQPELKQIAYEHGITTLLLRPGDEETIQDEEQITLHTLDGRIVFSHELAKQELWPTIDRQLSRSRLLTEMVASQEHIEIAQQVRQLLQQGQALRDVQNPSNKDHQILKRALIVQKFLTHPFFIAEQFTDKPGEFVPLAQTLHDFKALLSGHYDDTPANAFSFVGTLEEALVLANRR